MAIIDDSYIDEVSFLQCLIDNYEKLASNAATNEQASLYRYKAARLLVLLDEAIEEQKGG